MEDGEWQSTADHRFPSSILHLPSSSPRRRSGAGADDQFSRLSFGFGPFASEQLAHDLHRGHAQPKFWLAHRGHGHSKILGRENVAKADNGAVVGNFDP